MYQDLDATAVSARLDMETRSFVAYCLIQCVITIVAAAPSRSTSCQRAEYGRYCTLPSPPGRVRLIGDRLFVGAKDILLSFSFDLQVSVKVDLSPTNETIIDCSTQPGLQNSLAACRNFIQVIEPIPLSAVTNSSQTDRVLVCGTNAFFPKCRLHARTNISNSFFMTQSRTDTGFSPHSERSVVGVLATNGQFYSGTYFTPYVTQRTIGMAPRPLQGSSVFTVETPNSDPLWLNKPDFVSVHEIGSHIYFFVREPAYEIDLGRTVVYSRAIRVCKSDQGFSGSGDRNTFLTFQKARMQCTRSGESGSIPYDYDNLQATYLLNSSEPILYGIFSAPANGPEGAAICKFSFSHSVPGSLTYVFEEGSYYVPSQNDRTVWQQDSPGEFSCPGASGTQRTQEQARNYQLVLRPATPMDPQPIHSISGDEFTSIAVDVVEYMGVQQEILYYSLRSGEIRQFVTSGSEKREHVIYRAGETVSNILVYKNVDEIRYLYATTDSRIMSFVLGNCSQHGSCFECLDSKDPYCVWDSDRCLNKFASRSSSNSQLQSFLVRERNITTTCGERPSIGTPTPTTQPPTCQVGYATSDTPQPTNPPTTEGSDSSNQRSTSSQANSAPTGNDCNPPSTSTDSSTTHSTVITMSAGVNPQESSASQFSIPELVGASVGGFVIGIPCGLIVCCVFFVLFIRKRHGSDIECHRSADISNGPGAVTHVNNQLDNTSSQKKEQMLEKHQRYVEPSVLTAHTQSQKNVNSYNEPQEDEYDDDVLTDLPTSFVTSSAPPGTSNHNRRQVPGYRVPRGRTDSTRWLRASESDLSDSPSNSPLESPTAV